VEAQLKRAEIYLPVATNLALYCQSSDDLRLTNMVGVSKLPQPLPSLGSPWASFETNFAHVEFGGGFYHYGYRIQMDEAQSSSQTNVWELFLCREGQPEKLLHRFALASGDRVSLAQFTSSSISEYNQRLAKSPRDLDLHKAKISLLLQYKPQAVRAACIDAVEAMSDHWWPRLTLALVDTGKGNYDEAASELIKFTENKPSYSRYIYLAYFYQLNGRSRDAAQAIRKAISFPIIDLDDDQSNTECRGYSAGVYAFRSGEYETVIKLCKALLPVKENGNYAKGALQDLEAAAESATKGSRPDFTPSEAVKDFDPYERIDVHKLLSK
jgi:tetratricopeptide (TPR) repeat protein